MPKDTDHHETNAPLLELRDLLATFEANELTDQQDLRLQQLVAENESARHLYIQYMFMYGKIHQKHNKQKHKKPSTEPQKRNNTSSSNCSIFPLLEIEKDLLSAADSLDGFEVNKASNSSNAPSSNFLNNLNLSFLPGLITIVAAIVALSVIVILPIYWTTRPVDPKWNVVARITKTIDCRWVQGEKWSQEGAYLTAGRLLDLEAGLVEVEFSSGATMILQGPARFIVVDHNDSRLDLGRLVATVPEEAKGFTVRTPGMDVVDLGTEFGVSVGENRKSDVHVFKGVVEMETATKSNQTQTIRLQENEAIEYDSASGDLAHIPMDNKKFVRDLENIKGEITIRLRVTPQTGTVSSENIVGLGTNSSHFGSVIYKPENGPIRITGTITDWTGSVNSSWQGLWTCVNLTPTHFFKMNGTSVVGYPHLGDTKYGFDTSHQMGLGALGMIFYQKGGNVKTKLEDYKNGQTSVSDETARGDSYHFEILYDFEKKTISGSFNGAPPVTHDISGVLSESDSFILQVFTTNNHPSQKQ